MFVVVQDILAVTFGDARRILAVTALIFFGSVFLWKLFWGSACEARRLYRKCSLISFLLFVLTCGVTVHVCATKPQTNDTDGVDAPTYGLMSAYVPPAIGGLTGDWDVFSVTNVYFSSFCKTGDVARAEITIGEHGVAYYETIRIYAADNLEHPSWTNVYEHDYQNESSLTVQFNMSQFPTSFLHRAFFGLDYPQDSDGDGIADGDERYRYHSNPAKYDTDDDGLGDGDELRIGSSLISADTDSDGLTDAEELGGSSVMSASQMFWLDTSSCDELPLGLGGSYKNWNVSIPGGVSLAAAEYSVCNISLYGRVSFADSAVFVETCGQWMYAYPSWGSKVLYGSVVTNDTEYFVVEYRNISSDVSGAAKLTCQVIIPKAMRNVVYVSYREVGEGLDDPLYPLGVTCSDKPSPFDPQSEYSILPPVGHRVPVANTTIKYIIGFGSDPTVYNRYEEPIMPPTSNSNAYYTVDIVADDHAHIVFTGDGSSDLPDLDFWALPGDTNRVKLLIGKAYEAESDSPISITGVSDSGAVVSNVTDTSFYICRPVTFSFVPYSPQLLMSGVVATPGTSIHVEPNNLNGVYSFERNVCCMRRLSDGTPLFCCNGQCGCGGCSSGAIWYGYEGYHLEFGPFSCGCMYRPEDDDQPEMPSYGGIAVAFADDAIIFEDRYETAPDIFVERRSTSTRLNVCVNGGMNGGMYSVSVANSSKLVFKSGEQLPVQRYVEPGQCLRFYAEYEGCTASGSENDITVSAMFVDDLTGSTVSSSDSITIVRIGISVETEAVENTCRNRHKFAIGERFRIGQTPSSPELTLNMPSAAGYLSCPLYATNDMLSVRTSAVTYIPMISVIEPESIEGVSAEAFGFGVSANRPGWVGLRQHYQLQPLDVNFYRIAVQEIPAYIGSHSGYFDNSTFSNDWYHLEPQGAGSWFQMSYTNVTSDADEAASCREFLRVRPDGEFTTDENFLWSDGELYWGIPIGWNRWDCAINAHSVGVMSDIIEQVFTITQYGYFSIQKLGNVAARDINGIVYLNGEELEE